MKQDLAVVFVLDALEHARGLARVHRAALDCTLDRERRRRFAQAVTAADRDVQALQQLCQALGVNPEHPTTAREIVKDAADAMIKQISSAVAEADRTTAEAIACLCATLAETRSRANIEVLARIGPHLPEAAATVWNGMASALASGVRERQEFTQAAWRELQLKRIGVDEQSEAEALPEPRDAASAEA
jgi:hypothetical protein